MIADRREKVTDLRTKAAALVSGRGFRFTDEADFKRRLQEAKLKNWIDFDDGVYDSAGLGSGEEDEEEDDEEDEGGAGGGGGGGDSSGGASSVVSPPRGGVVAAPAAGVGGTLRSL